MDHPVFLLEQCLVILLFPASLLTIFLIWEARIAPGRVPDASPIQTISHSKNENAPKASFSEDKFDQEP